MAVKKTIISSASGRTSVVVEFDRNSGASTVTLVQDGRTLTAVNTHKELVKD